MHNGRSSKTAQSYKKIILLYCYVSHLSFNGPVKFLIELDPPVQLRYLITLNIMRVLIQKQDNGMRDVSCQGFKATGDPAVRQFYYVEALIVRNW